MILYLAGPISGTTDFNQRFAEAREALRKAGYKVLCPVEGCDPKQQQGKPYEYWIRRDLNMLLQAQGIAVMPNWQFSPGARFEVEVGLKLGMRIRYALTWVMEKENERKASGL